MSDITLETRTAVARKGWLSKLGEWALTVGVLGFCVVVTVAWLWAWIGLANSVFG